MQYHGHCGHGRFFDSVAGRCVTAIPEICEPGLVVAHQNATAPSASSENEKRQKLEMPKGPRVVCYVTSWALYRKGDGTFVPEHLDPKLCTDIVYAFAGLNPETLLIQPFDPWADIDHGERVRNRPRNAKDPRLTALEPISCF